MTTRSFSNPYSFSKLKVDEVEWVESMRRSIVDNQEETNIPVSIFTLPKVLLATNPESYIPQEVALGPFHHWRPEVYDMHRYKLAAARRTQTQMHVSFERIAKLMMQNDEPRIRACYHKFLDMTGEALAWMMAVDMAFLLEFLQVYFIKEHGRTLHRVTSRMSHLVDVSGKKLSHMAILRDLVMVENQIPLFLIKTMLEHQLKDDVKAEETLKSMLMGLYHELSPFRPKELPNVDLDDCDHLLDFLYHMTVPNNKELGIMEAEVNVHIEHDGITESHDGREEPFARPSDLKPCMNYTWTILTKSNARMVRFIKIILVKPLTFSMKLPWKILSRLPIINHLKEPLESIFKNLCGNEKEKVEEGSNETKVPLIEEIKIPSVTQMTKAGIFFAPVKGGIFDISFDSKTFTLYLPIISLDVNTEVYLRNLVAYEACVSSGPLVLARYTELMNGIIDTEEDAKFLSEKGIVRNHLKSDEEVANLWNGMSKSVKLTKVPKMDKVIEDVNKRYARTWRVKLSMFMKTYVFRSWKILALFAALCMLFLNLVQSFCSVYSCARVFQQLPDLQGAAGGGK